MSTTTAGTSTGRPPFGYALVCTVMLAASLAIAAAAFWPVYQSPRYVIAVAVAIVLGSLIAILGAVGRWPSPVVLLASVAAFLVVGVPVAVPSKTVSGVIPTFEGFIDLVAGVALGWKQLLTITLPVGDYEALLVPAFALVFVATVVGLSIALRTRSGELVVLAPIVVFGVAIAFGPSVPTRPLDVPIALLGDRAVLVAVVPVVPASRRAPAAARRLGGGAEHEHGRGRLPHGGQRGTHSRPGVGCGGGRGSGHPAHR